MQSAAVFFLALVAGNADAISQSRRASATALSRAQMRGARQSNYQRQFSEQLPIWVHAYARSGSSTVLSMVSQALKEESAQEEMNHVFSLFEPCHKGDELEPELVAKGCGGLIGELANCRFDKIKALNGWRDTHSKTRGAGPYNPAAASAACGGADVVAFKTISQAGELFHVQEHGLPVLSENPRLRMVDIVRDPRSIYASWMSTFPFNDTRLGGVQRDTSALKGLCDSFASNLGIQHSQVHRVVFESLVRDPEGVMRDVFNFLQVPFGDSQMDWVHRTFNAKDCPGVTEFIAAYSDCHTNATESLEKWRNVLQPHEVETFASYPACVTVAQTYSYPLN